MVGKKSGKALRDEGKFMWPNWWNITVNNRTANT
jgi:hypothetical protein